MQFQKKNIAHATIEWGNYTEPLTQNSASAGHVFPLVRPIYFRRGAVVRMNVTFSRFSFSQGAALALYGCVYESD